jgi:hypothetical protein
MCKELRTFNGFLCKSLKTNNSCLACRLHNKGQSGRRVRWGPCGHLLCMVSYIFPGVFKSGAYPPRAV